MRTVTVYYGLRWINEELTICANDDGMTEKDLDAMCKDSTERNGWKTWWEYDS